MPDIRTGETVALKAQFEKGAFPDEYMVTFRSVDGDVSGFVKAGNAVRKVGESLFLTGQVQDVTGSILTLFVRGSFFTNSGYVKVNSSQLERVPA